jgi:hypothetical protein
LFNLPASSVAALSDKEDRKTFVTHGLRLLLWFVAGLLMPPYVQAFVVAVGAVMALYALENTVMFYPALVIGLAAVGYELFLAESDNSKK